MRVHLRNAAIVGVFVLGGAACAGRPQAGVQAAGVEREQCDASSTAQDGLVRSLRVIHVEPLYSHVRSNNTSEARVNGAKLVVRPPQGVSAEQLTRVLQCHSARVLLGQLSGNEVGSDPYWLPNGWVNIEVTPDNGNFAVTLSADTVRDNLAVYGRANHYADEHMVAADPGLP